MVYMDVAIIIDIDMDMNIQVIRQDSCVFIPPFLLTSI